MVVSGNLGQTKFHEIVSMASSKTGILEFWNLPGRRNCTLYIKNGHLRCLQVGGHYADPLQAKAFLLELVSAHVGSFELRIVPFQTPCDPALNWPLERVLFSLTVMDDEIKYRTAELAPPDALYRAVEGASLPASSASFFWERAHPRLSQGITARELAGVLNISEHLACYYLAKLEGMGLVRHQHGQPSS
ncbi:MAG TPA: DUF4388 domain-containing protein [Meiothermus sp.]|jgi:hypothetical protein|nr:DUF4388 domain-containing protein [Meiothermus sp.]